MAAPAYAGIPVTDRRHASSFAVITGHEDPTKPESRMDWHGIAHGADTLVFLMGLTNLPSICERLIEEGKPAETPAAVIERGTTPGQRVVTGTLADLNALVEAAGLHPPALIVVGEVVRMRETLAWHDSQPLAGRRVLVPRVRSRPSEIVRLLKAAGADTAEVPVLRRQTLPAPAGLVRQLEGADWLVFTSAGALEALLEQLAELGRDVRALGGASLAAVGSATAAQLRRCGLRVDYEPETSAGFLSGFSAPPEASVLLVVEEGADPHTAGRLGDHRPDTDELVVSRLVVDERAPLPAVDEFDAIVFASSNTARRFLEAYPDGPADDQYIASIGPSTTATARKLGLRVDAEAGDASPAALAALLMQRLGPAAVTALPAPGSSLGGGSR